MVNVHARFLRALEATDRLDRQLEFLPSNKEIAAREAAGEGLTSPEVAVLSAYSKITLKRRIEDSTLPDEPWFHRILCSYFPPLIVERFGDQIREHPLRREIITTVLVNNMINRSGTTFVHRATEETGADAAQIARAYIVAREVFQLPQLWDELQALDNQVPIDAQEAAYQELRRLVDRATRWLVEARFPIDDVAGEIENLALPHSGVNRHRNDPLYPFLTLKFLEQLSLLVGSQIAHPSVVRAKLSHSATRIAFDQFSIERQSENL
jgi:glutamate dehydrogenase